MILYVSGPMTGYPDHNKQAFDACADALRAMGHTVVNPAELDHNAGIDLSGTGWEVDNDRYEDFLHRDLDQVRRCDGIVFLPGWSKSGGAGREGQQAIEGGLKLYLWIGDASLVRMPKWLFEQFHTTERLQPVAATTT